jgi:cobalamin biosynthesis protein CbiD
MAIFSYPYIYNCLDNITLNNLLNEKIFDKNTTEEECKKRNIEKIKEIAECCNFLAAKIEEKKCIFFEKKLKELQIKIIQLYRLNNE